MVSFGWQLLHHFLDPKIDLLNQALIVPIRLKRIAVPDTGERFEHWSAWRLSMVP